MDGGDLPTFYPTCVNFFVYNRYGVGGRLRRPFRGDSFLRTSASPRGGAQIILPFHGIKVIAKIYEDSDFC